MDPVITQVPAGPPDAAPATGPALSNVERATQAARANLAATGSATAGQVRASDGTFAPPLPPETVEANRLAAEKAAAPAAPAPDAGLVPVVDPNAPVEGEGTPEENEAAERRVTLMLGEDEIDVDFPDAAVAARVREISETAARAEVIERESQQAINEMLMVRESFAVDPVGFMYGEIKDDVAAQDHLILSLLTDKKVWDRLAPVISKLTDPNEFRTVAAEQKAARSEFKEEASNRIAETRAVQQNLRDVQSVCAAMLPNDLPPERQQVLYADMLRDLQAHATRYNLMTIPIEDIPVMLNRRLQANGIDPVAAAKLANEAINRPPSRASGRGVAPFRVKSATTNGNGTARVPAAGQPGSSFVASAERRRTVAAIPGGGAGSPSTGGDLTLPRNPDGSKMTSEQTLAWHRERHNKGIRSY